MSAISTRTSVLSIKKETTEGTAVAPAATTDYIALQDDFSMTPSFASLVSAEIKSSIGISKSIQGAEAPQANLSHYLRHSGVEGQAPNYGAVLEAALGATSTAGTQYDTVASSTTTVIKVDTGEGATFERGEIALIKDPVNGYRIRALDSISGDDLTPGFAVPVAPGTGVNLGKCVLYKPADSGHPTLSLWHYLGNGGALQLMTGARVTSTSIQIDAGQLINATYSLEGIGFYFNPITIASADRYIDVTDDDGTFAAAVATGVYKDPHQLADAIETALNDTASTEVYTVVYSNSNGKYTISCTGTVLSILWNTGTNAANTIGDKIGFSVAANDTGTAATTGYTSDNAITITSPYTPAYDSSDPLAAKDNEVMIGDSTDYACFKASTVNMTIATPKANIASVCAESGIQGSIIQSREVTITVSALLEQYDADKFRRFRENSDTKFQYSFGSKSGGNWIAGKCGALYVPTATITSWQVSDADGLAQLDLELKAFVNSSGQGEAYVGFV